MEGKAFRKALPTSAAIFATGPGTAVGFVVANTHASNAGDVIFYDNASAASGVVLAHISVAANSTAAVELPVKFENGVYGEVTGTVTGSMIAYIA